MSWSHLLNPTENTKWLVYCIMYHLNAPTIPYLLLIKLGPEGSCLPVVRGPDRAHPIKCHVTQKVKKTMYARMAHCSLLRWGQGGVLCPRSSECTLKSLKESWMWIAELLG